MLPKTADRPLWFPWRGAFSRAGLLAAGCVVALALLAGDAFAGQTPVRLGKADGFAVLGGQTVTNAGFSTLNGDLGVSPGSSLTGFPPGIVNGTKHSADPVAARAQADLTAAYNDAAGRQPPQALPLDIGGQTLTPGVYKTGATPALGVTGTLTLDGKGDPNSVFVFQVGSSLTTAVKSSVKLINGAQARNVFWQIGSSATLDTSSVFAGNILALTSIFMNDGVTLNGRALARNGAVTLIRDTINVPHRAKPPRRKLISWSIGALYRGARSSAPFQGSLDTRPAARVLGSALSKLGYENHTELKGQRPRTILQEAPAASVIAIFNHARAGVMTTAGGGVGACSATGLVASNYILCNGRYPGLGLLSPASLSGVRLMIFAGCNTAKSGPRYVGNLMQTAKRLGVGSVIGFRGLIISPSPGRGGERLYGNYFWARFAVYVRRGLTIGTAVHQAQGDLLKQSGRAKTKYGYDSAVIGGASPHPAGLRLTIKGSRASSAGDHVIERDQHGDVVSFSAPVTTAGARRLSVAAARSVAARFLTQQAPHVASAGLRVVSQGGAGLEPGEKLESFTYRSRLDGVPGPAVAQVEVDRRSGKVIFETARRVTPSSTRFILTRDQAIATARTALHGHVGAVVSAEKDVWSHPRWTVTLKAPGRASAMVELDAADGHVAGIGYAGPSS